MWLLTSIIGIMIGIPVGIAIGVMKYDKPELMVIYKSRRKPYPRDLQLF